MEKGDYFVFRDVVFVEIEFPYAKKNIVDMEQTENRNMNLGFNVIEDQEEQSEEEEVIAINEENRDNNGDGIEGVNGVEEHLGRGHRIR